MTKNKIRGITFDLWNTLIIDNDGGGLSRASLRIEATVSILDQYHKTYNKEMVEESYWRSQRKFENVRIRGLDTGIEPQIDDFLDSIDEGLASNIIPQAREKIVSHHLNAFLEDPPNLMPGALDILKILNQQGYRVGLICNSGTTPGSLVRQFLSKIGIAVYLKVLTFSDEEKLAKPAPSLFWNTLNALDVDPRESVHVGDTPDTDILGANRIGMKTVLIGKATCDHIPVVPDARITALGDLQDVLKNL